HTDRVEVHDYLKHQRSAAEIADAIEQKRSAGGLGNHVRWHVGAGKFDPDCPHCTRERRSQARSQPGSHPPWQPRSQPGSHMRSQNGRTPIAETETETQTQGGLTFPRDAPVEQRGPEAVSGAFPPKPSPYRTPELCPPHRYLVGY